MNVIVCWKIEGQMVIDAASADDAMMRVDQITIAAALEASGLDPYDCLVEAVEASEA